MTTECDKCRREREERERKRGAYYLTPEGRAEIRETWPNIDDGNAVRPLLDEVERLEALLAARPGEPAPDASGPACAICGREEGTLIHGREYGWRDGGHRFIPSTSVSPLPSSGRGDYEPATQGCQVCGEKGWPHYDRIASGIWICSECHHAIRTHYSAPRGHAATEIDGIGCPACGAGVVLATCDNPSCRETWIGERAGKALDARHDAGKCPPGACARCAPPALLCPAGECNYYLRNGRWVCTRCGIETTTVPPLPSSGRAGPKVLRYVSWEIADELHRLAQPLTDHVEAGKLACRVCDFLTPGAAVVAPSSGRPDPLREWVREERERRDLASAGGMKTSGNEPRIAPSVLKELERLAASGRPEDGERLRAKIEALAAKWGADACGEANFGRAEAFRQCITEARAALAASPSEDDAPEIVVKLYPVSADGRCTKCRGEMETRYCGGAPYLRCRACGILHEPAPSPPRESKP